MTFSKVETEVFRGDAHDLDQIAKEEYRMLLSLDQTGTLYV